MSGPTRLRKRKVLLACHDAGSANCIGAIAVVADLSLWEFVILASGPAIDVLRRLRVDESIVIHVKDTQEIGALLKAHNPCGVVVGTSHTAMLERMVIDASLERGIPSVGIVDWWSSYALRFSTPGKLDMRFLPTIIALSDAFAIAGARRENLPEGRLRTTGNPYWEFLKTRWSCDTNLPDEVREILNVQPEDLVCSVVFGMARHLDLKLGCDEEGLVNVLSPLPEANSRGRKIHWIGLKHPAEPQSVFESFVQEKFPLMSYFPHLSSLDIVNSSSCVVGLISTLQYESAILGKRVLSLLPGGIKAKMPFIEVFESCGIPCFLSVDEGRRALLEMLDVESVSESGPVLPGLTKDYSATHRILEALIQP